jgi:hypothetical protein
MRLGHATAVRRGATGRAIDGSGPGRAAGRLGTQGSIPGSFMAGDEANIIH